MTTWILILLYYHGGATSFTQDYHNETSCYNAVKEIKKQIEANNQDEGRLKGRIITLACTKNPRTIATPKSQITKG